MDYKIEKINLDEVDKLEKISRLTFIETFGDGNTEEDLKIFLNKSYNQAQLLSELQRPYSEFYFLRVNKEIAGYLKVNEKESQTEYITDNALEIQRIYLTKKFQRQGLGSVLIDFAEKIAQQKNKELVWLGVYEKNYNAQAFYKKHGYKRHGHHTFIVGNDHQIDYILTKKI